MSDRFADSLQASAASADQMVTPERSVFGTRVPRPTGVGRHLVVVVVFSLVALGIAIGFAEGGNGNSNGESATTTEKPRFQRAPSP